MRYDLQKCTQVYDIIGSINNGDIVECNGELAVVIKRPQDFTCNDCYCQKANSIDGYVGLFTYLCAVSKCTETNMYFVRPAEIMEEL